MKAADVAHLLKERIAFWSGGQDKHGRSVLTFPCHESPDKLKYEDLTRLLSYLSQIPSHEIIQHGFTVVLDMRRSKWDNVKPVLKALQDVCPDMVHIVFIIKPEKFWEKHKTNVGSSKYTFETAMISLDSLTQKHIDQSQLSTDLNGLLQFDHHDWLTSRIMLEEFSDKAQNLLMHFDQLMGSLRRKDVANDINDAKAMLNQHSQLRENIHPAAVESLVQDARVILQRLDYAHSLNGNSSGNAEYTHSTKFISSMLNQLHISRSNVQESWHQRKLQLDQCLQLQMFESDIEQMFKWIAHEKEKFLMSYTDIGCTFHQAHELQSQHMEFAEACERVQAKVTDIKSTAHRLSDTGHYAAPSVKMQAQKLDMEWKAFYTAIEDRTSVINLSTSFHEKIEQYMLDVPHWLSEVQNQGVPDTIDELEEAVARFDDLHAAFNTCYNEAVTEGKRLLEILQTPVANSAYNAIIAQADYSVGAAHILDIIHAVLEKNKAIEQCWTTTKSQLNQKLGLRLFQKDVLQVLTWLDNHGNVFLDKNTNVGRSLQKATSLQKAHDHFESIAENTITNADKLLHAADELAQSGECNAEQINMEAGKLEERIREFLQRLEQRKNLLNLTVNFYTHTQELSAWFEELRTELLDGKLAENVDEGAQLIRQFHRQREATIEAAVNTINEGESLLEQLGQVKMNSESASDDFDHIQDILENLTEARNSLEELWEKRKVKLDLSLELRYLEHDSNQLSNQHKVWISELQREEKFSDYAKYEHALHLHNEKFLTMQRVNGQIIHRAKDLVQVRCGGRR